MTEVLRLPVLPLVDDVLLPGMVVPVTLDGDTQAAVDAAQASAGSRLLAVPRLDGVYSAFGVLATLQQVGRLPSGEPVAIVRATGRVRIGTGIPGAGAALWVEATTVDDSPTTDRTPELAAEYKKLVISVLQSRGNWQTIDSVQRMTNPSALADLAGYAPYLDARQKLELLETADVDARLERLVEWVRAQIADMQVSEKIQNDVREGMEKSQREFLLRQQLAAIRKELGADGEGGSDHRARAEAADLPEKVREAVFREIDRLEATSEQSPEGGWIRTWLDTVLELPWNVRTPDNLDVVAARAVLDADHYGLGDVKDRMIEHLAVRARRAQRGLQVVGGRGSGAVLVLVGPPGVGKTSLGESVARALGRNFVRVSLGGVRDEAEIRGHRRTYVGALPGRIVRAIREAGSMNPVVLLDEIDKVGSDYRGDPAAALLEVLDPEQNHTFRDHYLDLDLDLSDVLFLATANMVDTIPQALLDRMEFVQLDGYTEDEKVAIARGHLLPREMERAALTTADVLIQDDALHAVAAEHTREAGVRQLDRALARILRKAAATLATDPSAAPLQVTPADLRSYLGRPRFTPETGERTAVPGVATGLAVTGTGGDVLFIEVTAVDGEPGLTVTGQLGDVMKESAQIALSYVRGHAEELGVDAAVLTKRLHLHVPAGAVPKDGPSAGVTMVTALASLASGRAVRADVGMTGEVTLSGRVLPIGGVKQKLLAADRAGLTTVFLPARNQPDLDDVPAEVRERLTIHLVADVAGLVSGALAPDRSSAVGVAA
ncbi:MAG: Lon protease [Blastococcus sp.]|nr:Lon protease [Blastococcus sp.]